MGKINPGLLYIDQKYDPSNRLSDSEMFEFQAGDGALWGQVMRPDGSFGGSRPCVILIASKISRRWQNMFAARNL